MNSIVLVILEIILKTIISFFSWIGFSLFSYVVLKHLNLINDNIENFIWGSVAGCAITTILYIWK